MNTEEIREAASDAGLTYVSDQLPGIRRVRTSEGEFDYIHPNGRPVKDAATLQRIRSLAIPPAYEQVWICSDANGHLQATGKDARGRKQYRYHARFREVRDGAKFSRMAAFCEALPKIHARVDADMAKRGLPREKVLATVVLLLERSLIRVGNAEYAKENHSYGLTTLRSRHVKVEGSEVRFKFLGKSKVKHDISLRDRRLARVVAKLQELPGQELFQYLDDEGNRRTVTSHDVNAYLHEVAGDEFTAKDFRTWAGTVLAIVQLAEQELPETKKATKAVLNGAIREVARQLGNTPSVCRKCYIHPMVFDAFSSGRLREFLANPADTPERAILGLLRAA